MYMYLITPTIFVCILYSCISIPTPSYSFVLVAGPFLLGPLTQFALQSLFMIHFVTSVELTFLPIRTHYQYYTFFIGVIFGREEAEGQGNWSHLFHCSVIHNEISSFPGIFEHKVDSQWPCVPICNSSQLPIVLK